MNEAFFTYDERHSPAWVKLRAYLRDELERQRGYNDKDHAPAETAWTRGDISRIKKLLALDEEPKIVAPIERKEVVGL